MSRRTLAEALAVNRIVLGANLVAAPGLTGASTWVGPAAALPATKVFARALGVRDVALGAGALLALRRGERARDWFAGHLLADATDFAATLAARRALPRPAAAGVPLLAAGATATGAWLASRLD